MRLPRYPTLTPLIHTFWQGTDPKSSLGPHWEQPGRSIVDNHLVDIPSPSASISEDASKPEDQQKFTDVQRWYFTDPHHPELPESTRRPAILRKQMRWTDLETYVRSASSLHTFQVANPEDAKDPRGDIVIRYLEELRKGIKEIENDNEGGNGEKGDEETLVVEWPLTLVLAKRSAA